MLPTAICILNTSSYHTNTLPANHYRLQIYKEHKTTEKKLFDCNALLSLLTVMLSLFSCLCCCFPCTCVCVLTITLRSNLFAHIFCKPVNIYLCFYVTSSLHSCFCFLFVYKNFWDFTPTSCLPKHYNSIHCMDKCFGTPLNYWIQVPPYLQ